MKKEEQSLSVLCADITGGARLPQFLGRPDAMFAVDRCERRIKRALSSHGGHLVDYPGNKMMAFFTDSLDALQSAIDLQQRIASLPPYAGIPMAARVGVCSGHQSREERYFSSEGDNPAASLSEIADPEHILLSVPKRVKTFPWSELAAESRPDLILNCGSRQLGIFQVAWQKHAPDALKMALSQLSNEVDRLSLHYKNTEIILNGNQAILKIGRQLDCEIILRDTRSSRLHGTIEQRLDRFVFVDRSANGTYVTFEDQTEFFIRHKELVLFGKGLLSFGGSASAPGAELVHFQTSEFP